MDSMKKYCIYFLVIMILLGILGLESKIIILTDSWTFFLLLVFCFVRLLSKTDINYKEIDKNWYIFLIITLIVDFIS
jgi:hypothetical protein